MKIDIKGVIISDSDQFIYDWFGINATSPSLVSKQIKKAKNNEDLEIYINSGGGSVFSGSEIYTLLKDYEGKVIVKIVGMAASAASVIAMSGDKVMISPTGQLMIHNSSVSSSGDHMSHENTAEMLKIVDESISNAYCLKTGLSKEELLNLMGKETYMSAQIALNYKFADEIMFDGNKILNSTSNIGGDITLPQEVIDKVRNELKKMPNIENNISIIPEIKEEDEKLKLAKAKARARLNIL